MLLAKFFETLMKSFNLLYEAVFHIILGANFYFNVF